MATSIGFGIRIPSDIFSKLDKLSKQTGIARSTLIIRALHAFFESERDPIFDFQRKLFRDSLHSEK